MANKEHKLVAASRKDEGKGASRRLRRSGHVPAIVYGGHKDPLSIQVEHNHLWIASQNEWFYSAILDLEVDGKVQKVLLRDMQRHPFKQQILHMDFLRVSENETLRASVPLHFVNQGISPAGKSAGVVVTHELNEVEVTCLPKDLPEFIEVDLAGLKVGDIMHLSEIKLPKGVTIPALAHGKEHDLAIVIAKHARVEAEEAAAPESVEVPAAKVSKDAGDAAPKKK
ncbi:50S ribosomal protein L25/general stress protein Ctc [Arenimonas caeni]|jgi:large subunit ribosomal protein L25|uniref:50S ribosomal protein L25/general stress protein Ctc n=1 Tax=Arenimonas caeni TaxID=2058085 RepID=UPI002A36A697|nr:50S ribosomal protein L25/general stress protein Ctc [Arenimonas caeni]MDY0020951.1 50S ribosomal protein L25/general stress protein Ctc [Arenimonas caeni]